MTSKIFNSWQIETNSNTRSATIFLSKDIGHVRQDLHNVYMIDFLQALKLSGKKVHRKN